MLVGAHRLNTEGHFQGDVRFVVAGLLFFDIHLEHRQQLAQLIVDLARDADPLLLARRLEMRRELPELLARGRNLIFARLRSVISRHKPIHPAKLPSAWKRGRTCSKSSDLYRRVPEFCIQKPDHLCSPRRFPPAESCCASRPSPARRGWEESHGNRFSACSGRPYR
jgi:hypothetical protein